MEINTKLTKEEMEMRSKLATHNALVELGKQIEKKTTLLNAKNKRKEELEKQITEFKKNMKPDKHCVKKKSNSWDTVITGFYDNVKVDSYIALVDEYMLLSQETESTNDNRITKLKAENSELKHELSEAHKEYDTLEKDTERRLKEREQYWTNRVFKLREKCEKKNSYIIRIYLAFMFVVAQCLIINYIGLGSYLNAVYYLTYNIIDFIVNNIMYHGLNYFKDMCYYVYCNASYLILYAIWSGVLYLIYVGNYFSYLNWSRPPT